METQSNQPPASEHKHVAKEKRESPLDAVKKWVGLATALLSLGSAIYGVLAYQADKRARAHEITEHLAASRAEQSARDYGAAWKSLQTAIHVIDADKGWARLLGGLDKEQEQVHTAQEDLAMEWLRALAAKDDLEWLRMLRNSPLGEGHTYSQITDPLIGLLSAASEHAGGSRKADLLAHLGWAYCLKQRDEVPDLHPDGFFRQALAVEAVNPYAQTFWGYWIMTRTAHAEDRISEAQPRFVAALSSKRAAGPLRAWVREREFSSLERSLWWQSPEKQAFWWQALNEMVKAGEPLEWRPLLSDLESQYVQADINDHSIAAFSKNLDRVQAFAPMAEHLQLLHVLLDHADSHVGGLHDYRLFLQVALANALERAGKPGEALTAWRDAQARMTAGAGDEDWHLDKVIDAAIQRLSAAGPA